MGDVLLAIEPGQWRDALYVELSQRLEISLANDPSGLAEQLTGDQFAVTVCTSRWMDPQALGIWASSGAVIVICPRTDREEWAFYLESGAADCVPSNLTIREMVARVSGVLRRVRGAAPGGSTHTPTKSWHFDPVRQRLCSFRRAD